jgi:methylmalonyl-CoA mutase
MARALAAGSPQKLAAEAAKSRADAVAKRRTVIVGTNQYPNVRETRISAAARRPDDAALQRKRAAQVAEHRTRSGNAANTTVLASLAVLLEAQPGSALEAATDAVAQGATLGEICRTLRVADTAAARVTPLSIHRAAEPFERLRDASAAHAAKTGSAPAVFQANIGPSRLYRLRADWTTAFFEVGGFKVLADRDFKETADAAGAALASEAKIVVITSADETYATAVEPLAKVLKAARPGLVVLVAGAPKENEAAWRAAGVDEFVNVASNTLDLLARLLVKAGVLPAS